MHNISKSNLIHISIKFDKYFLLYFMIVIIFGKPIRSNNVTIKNIEYIHNNSKYLNIKGLQKPTS